MYTRNLRGSEHERLAAFTRTSTSQPLSLTYDWDFATYAEWVYSWRTGSRATSDVSFGSQPFMGITPPRGSSLKDRVRYYNDVIQVTFPPETNTTNRFSKSDNGHEFSSVKMINLPIAGYTSDVFYRGNVMDTLMAGRIPIDNRKLQLPNVGNNFPILTGGNRTAFINDAFASISPKVPSADLLVTVVELLRGDIPSIVKNMKKLLDAVPKLDPKDWARYIGGEYLNFQFGWKPLINDVVAVIETLLKLDRLIFVETSRRYRKWKGPSRTTEVSGNRSLGTSSPGGYRKSSGLDVIRVEGSSASAVVEVAGSAFESEDYRLSSRLSSIARPNSRNVGFAERAEEILHQLGLVKHPTALWDLIPWSWLVDWATSMGSSLVNAQTYGTSPGKYNIDYAYFTQKSVYSEEVSVKKLVTSREVFSLSRPKGTLICTSKVREGASPFGFSVRSLDMLNTYQWSILVALGLARTR